LWIEEGWVHDANHTPDDLADDQVWEGRDAVMARYSSVIFGLTLEEVGPIELDMDLQGARAVVTGTTRMGSERSPNGERWTCVRQQGAWRIESITFDLEARRP
jgi:hypothetical protein